MRYKRSKYLFTNGMKKIAFLFAFLFSSSILFAQTDTIITPILTTPLASPSDTVSKMPGNIKEPLRADSTLEISPKPIDQKAIPVSSSKATFAKKKFFAEFLQKDIELKKGEIVSNVLRVVNKEDKAVSFFVDINGPSKWKAIIKPGMLYEIKPGDTLYIPVRVIPTAEFKGNMSYMVNAFITNEDGKQLASNLFFASTKKIVRWDLNILPRERNYFLNNEKTTSFGINLFNSGNEDQDILLTLIEFGRNIILTDTAGKIITRKFFDLNLAPLSDTTMNFNMSYFEGKRNFKIVDNETFKPKSDNEESKYTLFAKSTESKQSSKHVFTTGKKIDFVKLSNVKKNNPYGSSVVPLVVDANVYNILGTQPMMNLVMKGNTVLNNGANLVYFSQFNYTAYTYSNQFLKNNSWVIGYYDKRGDVQIGNVAASGAIGLAASGKGISGNYNISSKQTVGAFITKSPTFFGASERITMGATHKYLFSTKSQLYTSLGKIINTRMNSSTDFLGSRFAFSLSNKHQFGLGGTLTRNVSVLSGIKKTTAGYTANASYSGRYLKNKLATNLRAGYNSKNFGASYSGRILLSHRSIYHVSKKWTTILQNNFNRFSSAYSVNGTKTYVPNILFNNQLFFFNTLSEQKFIPNIFYNVSKIFFTELHYRGIGADYNYYSIEKNFRFSTSLKGGYNKIVNSPNKKEYFTFQLFSLCQYQNISANFRYNYGSQGVKELDSTLGYKYPQLLYLSVQHQYQFLDTRYVLQTSANYSYSNLANNHSFGVYPEIYFFSYDGWRFKLSFGYNVNVSNRSKAGLYSSAAVVQPIEDVSLKPQVNQNFTMGAGVRKEFGIPVPKKYAKSRFYNAQFVVFLDANGNRIKDGDEIALENVVIRLNENEVITNDMGIAKFLNVKQGNYQLAIIQLEDYKGWFPLANDSVSVESNQMHYIPFVRGIKIAGNVFVDREKYGAAVNDQLDLSKIRISVSDSSGKTISTLTDLNGSYTLYVPSGNYILSMDEKVLGEKFGLAQNDIEIELNIGMEGFFYSFYVVEKKRKINMKKAGDQ